MKALIADDDEVSRKVLELSLAEWGYEVVASADGDGAWNALASDAEIRLAILDWMMPGSDGLEVCRKARASRSSPIYIILLTTRDDREDLLTGFEAGADDYITKPFDFDELHARLKVGERIVRLESELAGRVGELEDVIAHLRRLQGLLPICSYCKKIRDDGDYWHQVEDYISAHSEAVFSHSICPQCHKEIILPELEQLKRDSGS
ncbi:MAG: response regulator [Acidobacteriota bacterium]